MAGRAPISTVIDAVGACIRRFFVAERAGERFGSPSCRPCLLLALLVALLADCRVNSDPRARCPIESGRNLFLQTMSRSIGVSPSRLCRWCILCKGRTIRYRRSVGIGDLHDVQSEPGVIFAPQQSQKMFTLIPSPLQVLRRFLPRSSSNKTRILPGLNGIKTPSSVLVILLQRTHLRSFAST